MTRKNNYVDQEDIEKLQLRIEIKELIRDIDSLGLVSNGHLTRSKKLLQESLKYLELPK